MIDLIAKRPICLLGLLDEQCAVGSGTDAGALSNFHSTFGGSSKKYAAYGKPKRSADKTFVLSHFAGEVIYTIEGWVEKNKDELSPDVTAILEVPLCILVAIGLPRRIGTPSLTQPRPGTHGV